MNIFNSIRLRNSGPACQDCVHFQNDPTVIEEAYPGLTTFSSGFASVRGGDGVCDHHQLYLSARDSCLGFTQHSSGPHQKEAEKTILI